MTRGERAVLVRKEVELLVRARTLPACRVADLDLEARLTFEGAYRRRVYPAVDGFLDAVATWERTGSAVDADLVFPAIEALLWALADATLPAIDSMARERRG